MTKNKKDIISELSKKTKLKPIDSKLLLEAFIKTIVINTFSLKKHVKIYKFGTFSMKISPKRIGRNPKSKELYIISERMKFNFHSSSYIKGELN